MSNDRVAAAWRCISRATAATQPPAWIYERKASIGFCARFQQAKTDETRLLCLYNGYGTLLGFDRVQETVAAVIGEEGAERFLRSVYSQQERDCGSTAARVLLYDEELRKLGRDLKQQVLKK